MTGLYIVSLLLLLCLLLYIRRRVKRMAMDNELNRRDNEQTRHKRAHVADVYVGDSISKETAERLSAFNNDLRREYKIIGKYEKWISKDNKSATNGHFYRR